MRFSVAVLTLLCSCPGAYAGQVLYSAEGNRLRRYDIDTIKQPPLIDDILIERAGLDPVKGRDINGMVCPFPDGSGRFIAGEDTGQPAVPPGWGVFDAGGTQVGKLTATYFVDPGDPFGCAFDRQGRLFTTEIGNDSGLEPFNGQLIVWFPPFDQFPGAPGTYPNAEQSPNFCKIASNIGVATSIAIDEQGRVYVTGARSGVLRFSPPFPTAPDAAGGCGRTDSLGSPLADVVNVEVFIPVSTDAFTPAGIARAADGDWYVSSVLTGTIAEYTAEGVFLRLVLQKPAGEQTLPYSTGHPQGLAVDADGDLYYADLALRVSEQGIGPDSTKGTVRRIAFDAQGEPEPPQTIKDGLAYPDALGILPGDLEHPACPGDCDQSGVVSIIELIRGINITLGRLAIDQCALFDADGNRRASIDELIAGVDAAVHGCPGNGR